MKAHERISPGKKSQPLAYLPLKWPLFGTLGGPCLGTLPLLVCYTLCTTSKAVNHLPTWYHLTLHDAWFLLDDLIPPYFWRLAVFTSWPGFQRGKHIPHIPDFLQKDTNTPHTLMLLFTHLNKVHGDSIPMHFGLKISPVLHVLINLPFGDRNAHVFLTRGYSRHYVAV